MDGHPGAAPAVGVRHHLARSPPICRTFPRPIKPRTGRRTCAPTSHRAVRSLFHEPAAQAGSLRYSWSRGAGPVRSRRPGNARLLSSGATYRAPSYADPTGLVEWYVNSEQGLEQELHARRSSGRSPRVRATAGNSDAIVLELALDTDLAARLTVRTGPWSSLTPPAQPCCATATSTRPTPPAAPSHTRLALVSGELSAVSGQRSAIRLTVDAAAAVFPITLDPTITGLSPTANWTAESDQAYAGFGVGSGTAGDVNGDGYDRRHRRRARLRQRSEQRGPRLRLLRLGVRAEHDRGLDGGEQPGQRQLRRQGCGGDCGGCQRRRLRRRHRRWPDIRQRPDR